MVVCIEKLAFQQVGFKMSDQTVYVETVECCGAVVKRRTRDREVPGSIPTNCKCCFLEQETLSTLLSTGFYPGKKRATWKISTRLLNVLPSINKVDYYYYYYFILSKTFCPASFGGSVGCAVRLETRRLPVQPLSKSATFFCRD